MSTATDTSKKGADKTKAKKSKNVAFALDADDDRSEPRFPGENTEGSQRSKDKEHEEKKKKDSLVDLETEILEVKARLFRLQAQYNEEAGGSGIEFNVDTNVQETKQN